MHDILIKKIGSRQRKVNNRHITPKNTKHTNAFEISHPTEKKNWYNN